MTWTALAAAVPGRLDPGNDEARGWLERELRDPAYRDTRDPLQRALEAIERWLSDLLDGVTGPHGSVSPLVAGLVALAAVAAVVYALRFVRRTPRARTLDDVAVLGAERLTAAEYRARAERALAEGRHGEALLDGVRAIARRAVDRTVLDDVPSLTAHEIAERLSAVFPDSAPALRVAADRFDAVAYGDASATRAQAEAVLELDRVLASARPRTLERAAAPGGVVLP